MKKLFALALFTCLFMTGFAQRISKEDLKYLRIKEDSMKQNARELIMNPLAFIRFNADSVFTRMLVRSLKTRNSFYYPFDSLVTISKQYAPDSSFRIFTWQMVVNENTTRQHGAIQMKTADGSLKLFGLIDKSDVTKNIADTFGDAKSWIGAVYYKIIQTNYNNQQYYTLLGYDENNKKSTRKLIEVLTFKNNEPYFGGSFFSFEEDAVKKPTTSRFIMEFKKEAGARLVYDNDQHMIIFEHLESETNEPKKKWTLIPDGDYEGFKWKNGKWVHIEKVFNQITPEGQEPVPSPVKDNQGNTIEDQLKDNAGGQSTEEPQKQAGKPKAGRRKN